MTGSQADIFRHYGLSMEGLSETALAALEEDNLREPSGSAAGPRLGKSVSE